MTSQELILDRIGDAIADKDIVLIRDPQYSNTGTLRTLDRDTLRQIAAVSYDFQRECVHFYDGSAYLAALRYGQDATGKAPWVKESIPDLVATVVAYLTTEAES